MTAANIERNRAIDARIDALAAAERAFGARHVMDYREHPSLRCVCILLGRGLRGDIYGRGRSLEGARRSLMAILTALGGEP